MSRTTSTNAAMVGGLLCLGGGPGGAKLPGQLCRAVPGRHQRSVKQRSQPALLEAVDRLLSGSPGGGDRSEERRVGKECRSRGATQHEKQKESYDEKNRRRDRTAEERNTND